MGAAGIQYGGRARNSWSGEKLEMSIQVGGARR
jgi:hypothetical protein